MKKIYHVAAEVAIFGAMYFYVNKKNKDLLDKIQYIQDDIEELTETIESNNDSSYTEHNKLFQLQEKTKKEMDEVHTIKSQLSEDVKQLKLAREQHHTEQHQIQTSLSEHVKLLQQRKQTLDLSEQRLQQKEDSLQQREQKLLYREQLVKELEQRLSTEQSSKSNKDIPMPPQFSYQPNSNANEANEVNEHDDEDIDEEIERELNSLEEQLHSVSKDRVRQEKSKSKTKAKSKTKSKSVRR